MTTPEVEVRVDDRDGTRVVSLHGEVDLLTAPSLTRALPAWVDGTQRLLLDLTAVTLLDSSGVRLVDRLLRSCAAGSVAVRLVSRPGTLPRRVLQIVELDGFTCDDLASALDAVGRNGA